MRKKRINFRFKWGWADLPRSLMTLGWSNSFMQAASRRKSSISVRVQMATRNKNSARGEFTLTIINTTDFSLSGGILNSYKSSAIWGIALSPAEELFSGHGCHVWPLTALISGSFCRLLTFHSLDSNFENRFLLRQQPFHHRAELSWWGNTV